MLRYNRKCKYIFSFPKINWEQQGLCTLNSPCSSILLTAVLKAADINGNCHLIGRTIPTTGWHSPNVLTLLSKNLLDFFCSTTDFDGRFIAKIQVWHNRCTFRNCKIDYQELNHSKTNNPVSRNMNLLPFPLCLYLSFNHTFTASSHHSQFYEGMMTLWQINAFLKLWDPMVTAGFPSQRVSNVEP